MSSAKTAPEKTRDLIRFLEAYITQRHDVENNLPYTINVLDECKPDELAHSRLLGKLLQLPSKTNSPTFPVLENFIQFLRNKKPAFKQLTMTAPKITIEKERVDIWIRDQKTAIIIENKACDAADQDAQLTRYIKKTKEEGYPEDHIYVLYLPHEEGQDPSDQSWGSHKEDFKERYANLGWDEILKWLKKLIKKPPTSELKNNPLLKSALEQVVDYWEGQYKQRERDKTMEKKMKQYLTKELKLSEEDSVGNLKIVNDKLKELEKLKELTNSLYSLEEELRKPLVKEFIKLSPQWLDLIRKEFPVCKPLSVKASKRPNQNGVEFNTTQWGTLRVFWWGNEKYSFNLTIQDNSQKELSKEIKDIVSQATKKTSNGKPDSDKGQDGNDKQPNGLVVEWSDPNDMKDVIVALLKKLKPVKQTSKKA